MSGTRRWAGAAAMALTLFPLMLCFAPDGRASQALSLPPHPLAFEANRGQTDPSVAFLARGAGYALYVTPAEAVFSLKTGDRGVSRVLRMHLVDAAPAATIAGAAPLPGRRNYYIGDDPSRWHTGIPTYREVRESGVYPGVDLVYHGRRGHLEYDFIVAPGADPKAVRLRFDGADASRIDDQGNLVLAVGGQRVVHHAPVAYQRIGGARVPVAARYVRRGAVVAFDLGEYDPRRPLIIDPALNYSSYLGGLADDEARAVAVDTSGNMYITGATKSANFPGTSTPESGGTDAFVTKLKPDGSIAFSTYLGSSGSNELSTSPGVEMGNAIALDSKGSIYVTGGTAGNVNNNAFPVLNEYHRCSINDGDVFLSILDTTGKLSYSTCVGGGLFEAGLGLAVDSGGDAYVAGWTRSAPSTQTTSSTGFPIIGNAIDSSKTSTSFENAGFFFKLDPSQGANGLLYSTYLGGAQNTLAYGVALDDQGKVYITGETMCDNTDFLPSGFSFPPNAFQPNNQGARDAFVLKLDLDASTAQNTLKRFTFFGGSADDAAYGIAVAGVDRVYIAGATSSKIDFPVTPNNAYDSALGSGTWTRIGFVASLNLGSSTNQRIYSTLLGGHSLSNGTADTTINAIAVDPNGRAYVTGSTISSDFPTQPAVTGLTNGFGGNQYYDGFITSIDATGATLNYSAYLGGSIDDHGMGITLDGANTAYVVGGTSSGDFPVTKTAQQPQLKSPAGTQDAFITKVGLAANLGVVIKGVGTPQFGQPFTYQVIVTNTGPDTATGVTLKLQLKIKANGAPTSGLGDSPSRVTTSSATAHTMGPRPPSPARWARSRRIPARPRPWTSTAPSAPPRPSRPSPRSAPVNPTPTPRIIPTRPTAPPASAAPRGPGLPPRSPAPAAAAARRDRS